MSDETDTDFKFSSETSSRGGGRTAIDLTIEGDVDMGLQQLQLVINSHFGHAQDQAPTKRAGRPAGLTKEVLAARNGGNGAPNVASRMTA